nr:uncharacterized protein LOC115268310 [Aedes albopictus]
MSHWIASHHRCSEAVITVQGARKARQVRSDQKTGISSLGRISGSRSYSSEKEHSRLVSPEKGSPIGGFGRGHRASLLKCGYAPDVTSREEGRRFRTASAKGVGKRHVPKSAGFERSVERNKHGAGQISRVTWRSEEKHVCRMCSAGDGGQEEPKCGMLLWYREYPLDLSKMRG